MGVVGFSEAGERGEVVFADEVGEGEGPVVADGVGLGRAAGEEFGRWGMRS